MNDNGLLERDQQLDELSARMAEAASGSGQMLLVGGEAGSGKTSLVGTFVDRLLDAVDIRLASCDAAGILGPLGPVFDIADSFGSEVAAAVEQGSGVDRVARMILGQLRLATRPNVLIAEDIHWADQATLDLLRFLGRRLAPTRTLLIATFRDDALDPGHELRLLLGELVNQPNVSRMALPPLSRSAVGEMVGDAGLDPEALFELTGGNPFFVSEIVNARSEAIPHSIRDVVLARVARLDAESRAILDLAAVFGPVVEPRTLRDAWEGDIAVELERCMHVGLLRSSADGITFRHALTRDVILGEMSPLRRSDFAQRILRVLQADTIRSQNVALLAHFAEAAEDSAGVRRYAVEAARAAAQRGAHRQAVLQYDRALRFSADMPEGDIASLLEARSFELHVTGQNDRAIEDISRAIEIRSRQPDSRQLGDDLRRRSRYFWITARSAESEADALAALSALDTGGPTVELAMACSNLSQLRMLSHLTDESIAWGERAIELATTLDAPHVKVHALLNVGTAQMLADGTGMEMLEEAAELGRRLGLHDEVSRSYSNRASVSLNQLALERARNLAREGIAYSDEHDIFSLNPYLHALLATTHVEAGDYHAAEPPLRQLLETSYVLAPTRIVALTALGLLGARRGDDPSPLVDEALELAIQTNEVQRLGPVFGARAEAAWLADDSARALAEAQQGFEAVSFVGDSWLNGLLGSWIVRAGGDFDMDVVLADPYRLEIAGDFAAAAEDWRARGFPVQEARARAAHGTVEQLRNALEILQAIEARPDAARVSRQLRALGVGKVPKGPRDRTRQNPAMLTGREIEVLRYLAQGMTNRQIAESLFISARTCGHHVSAIFQKLDVHSRAEATARASELGVI